MPAQGNYTLTDAGRTQEPPKTPEPPCDAAWQVIDEIEETLATMNRELNWTIEEERTIRDQVATIIRYVPVRD